MKSLPFVKVNVLGVSVAPASSISIGAGDATYRSHMAHADVRSSRETMDAPQLAV